MTEMPLETWKYEEQTKFKHLVFKDYFDVWVKIVGKFNKLNYFDCFGGCGRYEDSDGKIYYGSPILAAQIILNNKLSLKRNVNLIIIDKNKKNIENIKLILKNLKLDINPIIVCDDFDKTINEVLDKVGNLAPSFFFIDPFGFKIKMGTIKRIMNTPKSEIILNFMVSAISRFLSLEQNEKINNELFDGDDWKQLCHLNGSSREEGLKNLYRNKLKIFTKFVYAYKFLFPNKNRTYYYLFHLSNNVKGCSIMKSCFAKYNHGRTEYRGKKQNQLRIDEIGNVKINITKTFLLGKYHNINKKFIDIIKDNIDETPFLESEIYKAIKELEQEKKIKIEYNPKLTPTGKIRESIKEEDIIVFS